MDSFQVVASGALRPTASSRAARNQALGGLLIVFGATTASSLVNCSKAAAIAANSLAEARGDVTI